MADYTYDVALSFAGEDRGYVHTVATTLRERGIAVFYDEFRTVELWGQDLYGYLDDIYRNQARYAVIFVSANFARNVWTSHERRSIQARVMMDGDDFLLPVRLDDTELPGLLPTLSYLNGQRLSSEAVADLVVAKVGRDRAGADVAAPTFGVPLTTEEKRRLLAVRPSGWEYLILAGAIWQEWDRLEAKRLDHELRFAAGAGRHVSGEQLDMFLRSSMDELTFTVSKLEGVAGGRLEWAMGAPGSPGDAVRIEHLGRRIGTAFEEVLDWAARVRATVCDPAYRRAVELLARLADEPTHRMGEFVNAMVAAAGRIANEASAGSTEDLQITVTLELAIAAASIQAFSDEVVELGGQVPRA